MVLPKSSWCPDQRITFYGTDIDSFMFSTQNFAFCCCLNATCCKWRNFTYYFWSDSTSHECGVTKIRLCAQIIYRVKSIYIRKGAKSFWFSFIVCILTRFCSSVYLNCLLASVKKVQVFSFVCVHKMWFLNRSRSVKKSAIAVHFCTHFALKKSAVACHFLTQL
jgi:hypothetical protein